MGWNHLPIPKLQRYHPIRLIHVSKRGLCQVWVLWFNWSHICFRKRPGRTLQWRHNGCNSVSNHQPHDCFLNRVFRHISKKTPLERSASLAFVRGIHRRPVNSPHKWPVTQKMFPFDDVIMRKWHVEPKQNGCHLQTIFTNQAARRHSLSGNVIRDNDTWRNALIRLVSFGQI